ncbi:riboflavin synthase [Bradymonadaceae bacterium TMQ3]|uniref:Riboflavin synthase n=1 Tax=Lujinxingia sediminis TaxID=2480984 RepID=A0ABY0CX00_9DELT|nr:riboflavin synthase [Lujinxingia sediminis]RDV39845.1 riboflavin synthase [Bradymonadaceae bacterium TMQ3]RVU48111.1 riboflavin synthase [Lujinxingia sediminis]TXC77410.1 riboflavin synthase [Bradymonadales bacterium TMQ1]
MFTGLVADLGEVRSKRQAGENWELTIATRFDLSTIELGESIAVDGACLTVTRLTSDGFCVDASPETLRKTTLGDRRIGDKVHLERALRVGDRLGGHLVLGHVDGVGVIRKRSKEKNAWLFEVEAPPEVAPYLIDKGSVCVDGVSLTVNSVESSRFGLAIIPFTSDKTKITDYTVGQRVNLEADVLGKYVRKFVEPDATGGLNLEKLARFGFQ